MMRKKEMNTLMDVPKCFHIEDNWDMAHVMHVAGIFSSVEIGRKNGWNNPVPVGFSEFTMGKTGVWIFNSTAGAHAVITSEVTNG